MKLNYKELNDAEMLMTLHGEFDSHGASVIRPELQQLCEKFSANTIVIDLAEVNFIDSSGVGAIVFLFKRLREQGRKLRITSAHGQPAQLLQLLRVHKAMPVEMMSNSGAMQ